MESETDIIQLTKDIPNPYIFLTSKNRIEIKSRENYIDYLKTNYCNLQFKSCGIYRQSIDKNQAYSVNYAINPKNISDASYQLLLDTKTKDNKRLLVIKNVSGEIKKTHSSFLILNPEPKSSLIAILLPNGILEVVLYDDEIGGIHKDLIDIHPKINNDENFKIEFLRKEIIPHGVEFERSPKSPFYTKKWTDWRNQIHLFFRINPDDAKSLLKNSKNVLTRGPEVLIGTVKVRIYCCIPSQVWGQQSEYIFNKDREHDLLTEADQYGTREKFQTYLDPPVLTINPTQHKVFSANQNIEVKGSFIIECCRKDIKNKDLKRTIYFVDPIGATRFSIKYLEPRIVNDYFFERVEIFPLQNVFTVEIYHGKSNVTRELYFTVNGNINKQNIILPEIPQYKKEYYNWQKPKRNYPKVIKHVQFLKINEESKCNISNWKQLFKN